MGIIRDLWEFCISSIEKEPNKLIYLEDWFKLNPQYKPTDGTKDDKDKPKSMKFDNE
jgi:hypothetical protein